MASRIEGTISFVNASRHRSAVPGLHWISTMITAVDAGVCAASVLGRIRTQQRRNTQRAIIRLRALSNLSSIIGNLLSARIECIFYYCQQEDRGNGAPRTDAIGFVRDERASRKRNGIFTNCYDP